MGIAIAFSAMGKLKAGIERLSKGLQARLDRYSPKQQYRLMIILLAAGTLGYAAVALTSMQQDQAALVPMATPELPALPAYQDSSDVQPFKSTIDDERTQ